MSKEEQYKAVLSKEIANLNAPIEKLTIEQLNKAKEQQNSVLQKMKELSNSLEEIESILPPSNLQETTDKINQLCLRIERCRSRIQRVNKRAEIMLSNLSKAKAQPKTGKCTDHA